MEQDYTLISLACLVVTESCDKHLASLKGGRGPIRYEFEKCLNSGENILENKKRRPVVRMLSVPHAKSGQVH